MSYLFYEPEQQRKGYSEAFAWKPDTTPAGAFEGIGGGIMSGLDSIYQTGKLMTLTAAQGISEEADYLFGTEHSSWYDKSIDKAKTSLYQTQPDPVTTGVAGQVLHGLVSVVGEAAIGGLVGGPVGAAVLTGAMEGFKEEQIKQMQGVDAGTAEDVGLSRGLTMAAGVAVPAYLRSFGVLANAFYSAGANVALGGADRYMAGKILGDAGYKEMAEHYKFLDGVALTTDAVIGGTLGALARRFMPLDTNARPSERDAAREMNNVVHAERDTSPGLHTTNESMDAHLEAQVRATEQLLSGERVDVSNLTTRMEMEADPIRNVRVDEEVSASVRDESPEIREAMEVNDAVQIRSTKEVDVREQTRIGEEVPARDAEGQKVAREGEAQREVNPDAYKPETAVKRGDIPTHEDIAVRQVVEARPDMQVIDPVTGETVSAKEMLKRMDEMLIDAETEGMVYRTAAACAIYNGM